MYGWNNLKTALVLRIAVLCNATYSYTPTASLYTGAM